MTLNSTKLGPVIVLVAGLVNPLAAEARPGPDARTVILEDIDTRPATTGAARRTLARIEEAALTVCGAPRGSLIEVRRAARRSACWKDSVEAAVAQVGHPLLAHVHRRGA